MQVSYNWSHPAEEDKVTPSNAWDLCRGCITSSFKVRVCSSTGKGPAFPCPRKCDPCFIGNGVLQHCGKLVTFCKLFSSKMCYTNQTTGKRWLWKSDHFRCVPRGIVLHKCALKFWCSSLSTNCPWLLMQPRHRVCQPIGPNHKAKNFRQGPKPIKAQWRRKIHTACFPTLLSYLQISRGFS